MAPTPAGKKPATTQATKKPAAREKAAGSGVSGKRRRVDWDAVERDYRTSQMTLRELGEKHGCDHAAIARKAKREGWERDLTPAVRQATNAKLIEAAVNTAVTNGQQEVTNVVLAVAEVNTQVILKHRRGLQRLTHIQQTLLDQIEQAAAQLPDLAEVIEMVRQPDDNGIDKANDALRKAMSRSSLVDDLKKLAEIDEKVRKGEREAFSIPPIGADTPPDEPKQKRVVLEFVDVVPK